MAISTEWRTIESQIGVNVAHTRGLLVEDNSKKKFDVINTRSSLVHTIIPIAAFHDSSSYLAFDPTDGTHDQNSGYESLFRATL